MSRYEQIAAILAKQTMRIANTWESGWYVTVLVDGEPRRIWATDK